MFVEHHVRLDHMKRQLVLDLSPSGLEITFHVELDTLLDLFIQLSRRLKVEGRLLPVVDWGFVRDVIP